MIFYPSDHGLRDYFLFIYHNSVYKMRITPADTPGVSNESIYLRTNPVSYLGKAELKGFTYEVLCIG